MYRLVTQAELAEINMSRIIHDAKHLKPPKLKRIRLVAAAPKPEPEPEPVEAE